MPLTEGHYCPECGKPGLVEKTDPDGAAHLTCNECGIIEAFVGGEKETEPERIGRYYIIYCPKGHVRELYQGREMLTIVRWVCPVCGNTLRCGEVKNVTL